MNSQKFTNYLPNSFLRFLSLLILSTLLLSSNAKANALTNGDFANGLNAWTAPGATSVANEEAVLNDTLINGCGQPCATLIQGVLLESGVYSLDFDFLNLISAFTPQGSAPDTLFASLYFTSNIALFDPTLPATFSSGVGLFDAAGSGIANLVSGATITTSGVKGGDWQHFSYNFSNQALQYAVIVLELFAQNATASDSTFLADNFVIPLPTNEIPEPATALLLGLGAGSFLLSKKRKTI